MQHRCVDLHRTAAQFVEFRSRFLILLIFFSSAVQVEYTTHVLRLLHFLATPFTCHITVR